MQTLTSQSTCTGAGADFASSTLRNSVQDQCDVNVGIAFSTNVIFLLRRVNVSSISAVVDFSCCHHLKIVVRSAVTRRVGSNLRRVVFDENS